MSTVQKAATGKSFILPFFGRELRFLNQRCRDWIHPYEYPPNPGGTLTNSGCGIFSLCHVIEFISSKRVSPEELADFSCQNGARGDDGTDRPVLLGAFENQGKSSEYGFKYNFDGLLNDHSALWETLVSGGAALCNLRVGHIVALVGARVVNGEKQVLALDCHSESADSRICESVREVLPKSQVIYQIQNAQGIVTGTSSVYGAFWVPLTLAKNFNLLHKL